MSPRRRTEPRFGLFVEGANYSSSRGWDALVELWRQLATFHGVARERVSVFGFHKGQIVMMADTPGLRFPGTEPLDVRIAREHERAPFDVLIVAFDAMPPNQELVSAGCLNEIVFVVQRFLARRFLPDPFLRDAQRLLEHYGRHPRPARDRRHAPRLDALFMEPEFEALAVCDEQLVRRALGIEDRPRDWPSFREPSPKDILARVIPFAARPIRARVRGDMKSNRHAWAHQILREAEPGSRVFEHAIMRRLGVLLTGS